MKTKITHSESLKLIEKLKTSMVNIEISELQIENSKLKKALVGLIGCSDKEELKKLKELISKDNHFDKESILAAIDTLLESYDK